MDKRVGFIFDMDGVIADNMSYHAKSWVALFKEKGHDVLLEDFVLNAAGRKAQEVVSHYLKEDLSIDEIERLSNEKDDLYRTMYGPHLQPLEGFMTFIQKSQSMAIPCGVGTGSSPENIDFVLGGLDLKSHFKSVVGASQVKHGKPNPEIFLKVASELAVSPETCIVFEDSQFGVQAASSAGMQVVGLSTSHSADEMHSFGKLLLVAENFKTMDPESLISNL
jgi:beta-phosphoglucomutase